jgi:hypothetical protein
MLVPVHLRDLTVDPATHPRGQPHLSACSGLAQAGRWLYMVSDDEHHLSMLQAGSAAPVELHRVLAGDLPQDKGERKQRKPDLEALASLPATTDHPHGALLALGSGSRPNRKRGWRIGLDGDGRPAGAPRAFDLSAWYRTLDESFADLNIEGAFVGAGSFHLLQRANKGSPVNACIAYPLAELQDWLADRRSAPPQVLRIRQLDLGDAGGVPLGITDAAVLPDGGWIFSAVAEDTQDSFTDGACAGSAIGWVGGDGRLQRIEPLAGAPKVEGIAVAGGRLLMVTDADDPGLASQLLALELER